MQPPSYGIAVALIVVAILIARILQTNHLMHLLQHLWLHILHLLPELWRQAPLSRVRQLHLYPLRLHLEPLRLQPRPMSPRPLILEPLQVYQQARLLE